MHSLLSGTKLASHDTAAVVCDGHCAEDSSHQPSHDSSSESNNLNSDDFGINTGHFNTADPDEVEILALIGEHIPRYRLSSDAVLDFSEYNYTDLIQTDTLHWNRDVILSPELTGESLRHFVLCAERVSQMTRTCDDIEALAHLLEEKERDLELTARIGQTLLSKNKDLSNRVEALEEQLTGATDKVSQLRHDLSKKDELLRYYTEDLEHETRKETAHKSGLDLVNVDFLESKVKILEDENLNLRLESAQLKADTDSYEDKEKKLVEDCIQQLAEVNLQVESLAEELHQKAKENIHHKEEATKLLTQVTDLQKKIRKLTLENMDMREKLTASSESQWKLTQELGAMKDKHDELLEMLEDAQDELKLLRGRNRVHSRGQHHDSAYADSTDSLASELETSLQQELSQSNRRSDGWKVFETARAAKQAAAKAVQREASSATRMSLALSHQQQNETHGHLAYTSDVESIGSDNCSVDMDNFYEVNSELGRPGIPGSSDLESALKRLVLRRANEQNEKDFQHQELERRRKKEDIDMNDGVSQFSQNSVGPPMFRSPLGSVSSKWSSAGMSVGSQHFKLPEKLQIVKPLEGSMTLRHWQHLATPHLAGIFEERDGVQMKGESKLDLAENVSSLSDFEEDDHSLDVHTRKEQGMGVIYTFTDSTVRNLGSFGLQGNHFSSSMPESTEATEVSINTDDQSVEMSTHSSESQKLQMSHQNNQIHSMANTQSTYSMSLGLAALLQGRDNTTHALIRASASKPVTLTGEVTESSTPVSNSDLNRSFFTSRSFDSQPLSSSTPKIIFGSRSFDHTLMKQEEKVSPKESEPVAYGQTGKGFLQQLKSKGYSLYKSWGGGEKGSQNNPESSTDGADIEHGSTSTTVAADEESAFAHGANVGVLSVLTDFRRGGML